MTKPGARRLLAAVALAAAFNLPAAFDVLAQGDEPGTLKGVRGAAKPGSAKPGAAKIRPGVGSRLMEEEGIFYFIRKPAGRDQPKRR
jgi:hypothetical protein